MLQVNNSEIEVGTGSRKVPNHDSKLLLVRDITSQIMMMLCDEMK